MKILMFVVMFFSTIVSVFAGELPLIAVSDLDPRTYTHDEALSVSDDLRSELFKTGAFRVVERTQMESILKEQGFQQSGCTSEACAVEAGQLLGVKYMVVGSIGSVEGLTILTARIVDVASGEVLATETVKNRGGLSEMLKSGVKEIAGLLAARFSSGKQSAGASHIELASTDRDTISTIRGMTACWYKGDRVRPSLARSLYAQYPDSKAAWRTYRTCNIISLPLFITGIGLVVAGTVASQNDSKASSALYIPGGGFLVCASTFRIVSQFTSMRASKLFNRDRKKAAGISGLAPREMMLSNHGVAMTWVF